MSASPPITGRRPPPLTLPRRNDHLRPAVDDAPPTSEAAAADQPRLRGREGAAAHIQARKEELNNLILGLHFTCCANPNESHIVLEMLVSNSPDLGANYRLKLETAYKVKSVFYIWFLTHAQI